MYIDMHCHSVSSDDSRATVEGYLKWVQVLRKRGHIVDGIVLTEHRKFDQDMDYSILARQYEVLVLRGSELDTSHGHFLVYGVTQELTRAVDFSDVYMDASELVWQVRAHGAVAIPAHPGRPRTGLCDFFDRGGCFEGIGIVETLNGGSRMGENERAQALARSKGYQGIGGSDAHLVSSIGTCLTAFPYSIGNESQLVEALEAGDFTAVWLEETDIGHLKSLSAGE